MALTYKWFRCIDCGYSGEITTEEIAAHRSKCARGTTEPIAEQARAAEQPDARAWNIVWELAHRDKVFFAGIDGAMARLIEEAQGLLRQPAQPPAEDVVERMCSDYGNLTGTDPDPIAMAAALAVAREGMVPKSDYDECVRMLRIESEAARQREGYVSLEDVEKALRQEIKNGWGISADDTHTILWHVRNRLAKPAEQTDEQKVEAILVNALKKLSTLGNGEHPGNSIGNQIAQKALTDAIRLREELKAGKQ